MTDELSHAEVAPAGAPLADDTINAERPISETPHVDRAPVEDQAAAEKAEKAAREAERAKKEEKAPSNSEAIKKAMEEVKAKAEIKAKEAQEQAKAKAEEVKATEKPQVEAKAEPTDEPKPSAYRDPPQRFDDAAKAEWDKVPEAVRGATNRAFTELEQGIQKYKTDAESYERLREYDEIARQNNRDLKDSLQKITEIEKVFAQNPIAGLDMVLRELGAKKADGSPVTLLDIASHVMGQKPEERAMQQNSTIASLQAEIAGLKQQLSGVSQTIHQQQQTATLQQVQEFAKTHPRFDELANDIGFFLETKRATTLQEAYDLAERLNPGPEAKAEPLTPAPQKELAHTQAQQPKPLNPAGQKSISGAPAPGAKSGKGRVMSNSEAIRIAMQKVG